jgi:hypothetical protein
MAGFITLLKTLVEINFLQSLLSVLVVGSYIAVVVTNPSNPSLPDLREFTNLILGVMVGGAVTNSFTARRLNGVSSEVKGNT